MIFFLHSIVLVGLRILSLPFFFEMNFLLRLSLQFIFAANLDLSFRQLFVHLSKLPLPLLLLISLLLDELLDFLGRNDGS